MAEINTLKDLAAEVGDEEAIRIAVEQLSMDEGYARFVLAMERGEIDGDVFVNGEDQE